MVTYEKYLKVVLWFFVTIHSGGLSKAQMEVSEKEKHSVIFPLPLEQQ